MTTNGPDRAGCQTASQEPPGTDAGPAGDALTCGAVCSDRAVALFAQEAVQEESVLAAGVQRGDGDRAFMALHRHHPGPVPVLELDHKGVEVALGDRPGEAQ